MFRLSKRTHFNSTTVSSQILKAIKPCYFDAIYIINLDTRTDRWRYMIKQLQQCGLLSAAQREQQGSSMDDVVDPSRTSTQEVVEGNPYLHYPCIERYSAVVGKKSTTSPNGIQKLGPVDAEIPISNGGGGGGHGFLSKLGKLRLEASKEEKIWGMDLNDGAIGCALSHIHLWSLIRARGYQCALILEDDSSIPESFLTDFESRIVPFLYPNKSEEITKTPKVSSWWDLVYLSGLDTEGRLPFLPCVYPGIKLVPRMHRTTNCYITNHLGCEHLLETCVPLTYQLDTQMTMQTSVCPSIPSSSGDTSSSSSGIPPDQGLEHFVLTPLCFTAHPALVVQDTAQGSDIQDYQKT